VIVVVHAHPYPSRSRAGASLVQAIGDVPSIEIRTLYSLYPDFDIDAAAERAALERARLVVWLHPVYWYTPPALMKHWFDTVLADGWSHGSGAALRGKDCLWVTTLGNPGEYRGPITPVVEQIARQCGMNWLDPFVVEGAHAMADDALREQGAKLRARLDTWAARGRLRAV
jgi:glutathione-regulated potassium-efflux system ancillary protein KefF